MRIQSLIIAATIFFAVPAFAHDGVHIENPYARTNGGIGATGAVFFEVMNHADVDDRLIGVASDVAEKVEMHTHKQSEGGVMQMMAVPEGFAIAALQGHALQRGGDHIMLMGLKQDLKDGDIIHLTLTFEHAGVVEVDAAVDSTRKPGAMGKPAAMGDMEGMDHSTMGHGTMDHSTMETAPAN